MRNITQAQISIPQGLDTVSRSCQSPCPAFPTSTTPSQRDITFVSAPDRQERQRDGVKQRNEGTRAAQPPKGDARWAGLGISASALQRSAVKSSQSCSPVLGDDDKIPP